MLTRPFGNSHRRVSPIGLGLAAIGRPAYITLGRDQDLGSDRSLGAMERRTRALLDHAYAAGVRYFDCARSYGDAERFVARWVRDRGRLPDDITLGSKWGYRYIGDWRLDARQHEEQDLSADAFRRQWQETQETLGPFLDLYMIHSATLGSGVLEDRAVLHALSTLKSRGFLVGVSLSGTRQGEVLDRALGLEIDGVRLFDAVEATWNLLEPSVGPYLAGARAVGMGVIIKEVLANGRLTTSNQDPDFEPRRELLQQEALRLDTTIDALAIAAAINQPWATVVLSGAVSTTQLDSNLQALDIRWDDDATIALMDLTEPPPEYWGTRARLPWH